MPLVANGLAYRIVGTQVKVTGTLDFDSSYPTGGEALAASLIGLGTIDELEVRPGKGLVFEWDKTNGKVLAYTQGWDVGAAGAVVIDDFPITAGPGATSGTSVGLQTGAGAGVHRLGVMKEVQASNDLSTITGIRFTAYGVG